MATGSSETRTVLLDAAERIMREQGYAALTSRQLGKAAGMSPQIVYYYFATMDDLFEAIFQRLADFFLTSIDVAARAENPLLALWRLSSDRSRAVIITEIIAAANHRKGLRMLISDFGVRYHARQTEIIGAALTSRGVELAGWTPSILAVVLENLARGFALGADFDIAAHVDAQAHVAAWLGEVLTGAGGAQAAARGVNAIGRPFSPQMP
jgi:AcrR family transcriptional regulator